MFFPPFVLSYINSNIACKDGVAIGQAYRDRLFTYSDDKYRDWDLEHFGYHDVRIGAFAFTAGKTMTVTIVPGDLLAVNFTTDAYSKGMTVHWRRDNDSWAELSKGSLVELLSPVTGTENVTYSFIPSTANYRYNSTPEGDPVFSLNCGNLRFARLKVSGNFTRIL
jgi:hypothetical protein